MKISDIISCLESFAPREYQEEYDNAGLLTGSPDWDCTGVLVTLDSPESIVREAMQKKCNLVVSHHPIIFGGLNKLTGSNYVENAVLTAIRNNIALYAIHTNLDNQLHGVNGKIAEKLGLINQKVLVPRSDSLYKLFTFAPKAHADKVRDALFAAGAGNIGNYSEASFNAAGTGTFKAGMGANPFVGEFGQRHEEEEIKIEVIFPGILGERVVKALKENHPYEEPAYDLVELANPSDGLGSGLIGELKSKTSEGEYLATIKRIFNVPVIRHSPLTGRQIGRVAVCGGSGSSFIPNALNAGADIYLSADIKYHHFFEGEGRMLIADIGHFESEQFTIDLLHELLRQKFRNFAVLKPDTLTNPVNYYL
ncbi:MAG: Nif3-like dinuclear metal center hexameric protein [Chitinophagales bacterium]